MIRHERKAERVNIEKAKGRKQGHGKKPDCRKGAFAGFFPQQKKRRANSRETGGAEP